MQKLIPLIRKLERADARLAHAQARHKAAFDEVRAAFDEADGGPAVEKKTRRRRRAKKVPVKTSPKGSQIDRILAAFNSKPIHRTELATKAQIPLVHVAPSLTRLISLGKIERTEPGVYRKTP